MPRVTLFLDDGGVMNDNSIRGREWQRMVGEFFAPRLGGTEDAWARANWELVARTQPWNVDPLSGEDYAAWYRRYQIDWLKVMADDVGVGLPGDDEALALAREAARYVTYNCRSAFADAVPAIQALADSGLTLHTASGEDSCELAGYLTSMGVRGLFTHLFGPDLIDTFKRGARYYERAFASAGADPALCMVVDDSVEALGWAAEAGAQTVLVSRGRRVPGGYDGYAIQDLASLLPVVERLGGA